LRTVTSVPALSAQAAAWAAPVASDASWAPREAVSDRSGYHGDAEEPGRVERAAAHRLLAQLSIAAGGGDAEADPIVALLRDSSPWAATRSLLDAYHRACAEKPPSATAK
jgi:hypothetical protein